MLLMLKVVQASAARAVSPLGFALWKCAALLRHILRPLYELRMHRGSVGSEYFIESWGWEGPLEIIESNSMIQLRLVPYNRSHR